jgi:di/tricarboxylate transporter
MEFYFKRLLLGIMSVTGFLSLWISNVASASMMLPITIAIVKQISKLDRTFTDEFKCSNPNAVHGNLLTNF